MKLFKLPALAFFLILSTMLTTTATGQQKRQTPDKTPAKPAAPAPAPPTFETLLAAHSFNVYGEVRGVGQLVQSSTFNEVLEPFITLAGPPKEFRSFIKWLNAHADDVMTSRMMVAAWPTAPELPYALIAIEFASPEEAIKLERQLNEFLPSVLPPVAPASSAAPAEGPNKQKPADAPRPQYYSQRAGSLILLTPTPLQLKKLKPAGSKPLFQDPNFSVARNRFTSESIFVFVDVSAIEKEQQRRAEQYEKERKQLAEQSRAAAEAKLEARKKQAAENPEIAQSMKETEEQRAVFEAQKSQGTLVMGEAKPIPAPDPMSALLSPLGLAFFNVQSDWPDGIGVALSLESESFDLKALMVNSPGEKSAVIPFTPMLIPGPAIVPESPNILPAGSELLVTMSLDFPQVYEQMAVPIQNFFGRVADDGTISSVEPTDPETPFTTIEKQLKINIKDELLPLLGSEIVLSLPLHNVDFLGVPRQSAVKPEAKGDAATKPVQKQPIVAISLRDKEGMRRLLPKLIEGFGLKGVMSLAQTERREDTELVSFANMFAYAFVGNFLVLSTEAASVKHVVDSYVKRETLSSDIHFRNYTRWQPRQLQGQIYVSPALMEGYKKWAESSSSLLLTEQTRAFMSRLTTLAQPITYSLSNEGLGALHELHLPKNLILMAVAGMAGQSNPPPMVQNERRAMGGLWMIANAQQRYKSEKGGGYASLEQLLAENMVPKEMIENFGYKFEVTVGGEGFQITAVPIEYGKTGKLSFFIDSTNIIRGADHAGGPATVADPPLGG